MKCPNCGKKSAGICAECHLADHPPKLKDTVVSVCECGRTKVGGEWLKQPDDKIRERVERNLILSDKIRPGKITVEIKHDKKHIQAEINIKGEYEGREFETTTTGKIKKRNEACQTCSKLAGNSYEAILQYRGEGLLELESEQVPKAEKVRGGIDYYILSLRYARSIASRLHKSGFTTRESHKVYGMKEGKTVFRTSISLKPPPFNPGDIISRDGEAYLVTKNKETMETYNLSRGKPDAIPRKRVSEFTKIGDIASVHAGVASAVTPDEIQILDLKTYETNTIKKTGGLQMKQGDEIRILKHRGKTLIVPEHLL